MACNEVSEEEHARRRIGYHIQHSKSISEGNDVIKRLKLLDTHTDTDIDTDRDRLTDRYTHTDTESHTHTHSHAHLHSLSQIDLQKQSCYTIVNDMAYTRQTEKQQTFHLAQHSTSLTNKNTRRENAIEKKSGDVSDFNLFRKRGMKQTKETDFEDSIKTDILQNKGDYKNKFENKSGHFHSNDLYNFLEKLTDNQMNILQRYMKTDVPNTTKDKSFLQTSESYDKNKHPAKDENKLTDSNSIPKLKDFDILRNSTCNNIKKHVEMNKTTSSLQQKSQECFHNTLKPETINPKTLNFKTLNPKTPKEKPQSHADCFLPHTPPTIKPANQSDSMNSNSTVMYSNKGNTQKVMYSDWEQKRQTQTQIEYPCVSQGPPSLKCESNKNVDTLNNNKSQSHSIQFTKLQKQKNINIENENDVNTNNIIDDVLTPKQISRNIPPLTLPPHFHNQSNSAAIYPTNVPNNLKHIHAHTHTFPPTQTSTHTTHIKNTDSLNIVLPEYTEIYVDPLRQDIINKNLLQRNLNDTNLLHDFSAPNIMHMPHIPINFHNNYSHVYKTNVCDNRNVNNNNMCDINVNVAELEEVDDILSIITSLPQC